MQIMVNGESKTCPAGATLAKLLEILGINPKSVVVEKNLDIVDMGRLDEQEISEGDCIEIIRFVGGG